MVQSGCSVCTRSRNRAQNLPYNTAFPEAWLLALAARLGCRGHLGVPVIRLGPQPEERRWWRSSNSDGADLDPEEASISLGQSIEPVQGLAMLLSEGGGHPHDRAGIGTGGVGNDLAEMAMVGPGQLVLDNQNTIVG